MRLGVGPGGVLPNEQTAPADKCSRTIQKLSVATTPRRESSPNRASSSLRSAIAGPSCLGGEHVLDGDAGELLVAHRVGDGEHAVIAALRTEADGLRGEKVRLSEEDLRALHQLKGAK
jgi:hypothetical protein